MEASRLGKRGDEEQRGRLQRAADLAQARQSQPLQQAVPPLLLADGGALAQRRVLRVPPRGGRVLQRETMEPCAQY